MGLESGSVNVNKPNYSLEDKRCITLGPAYNEFGYYELSSWNELMPDLPRIPFESRSIW